MKYLVTLEIHTPTKHLEDISINRDLFQHGILHDHYPDFTREEFIIEMVKRLAMRYMDKRKKFITFDGMIDWEWFSIEEDINEPELMVRWYDSKYDFENWDENNMGGNIMLYDSPRIPHEDLISQAELALEYLFWSKDWQDEPTLQDELHVLSELWK